MKPIHAALAAVTIAATLATGTAALSEPNDLPSWQQGENRIGNRVFNDLNGNGIADPDEPGIANVTVTLDKDYAEAGANEPNWVTIASGASSDGGWWSYDHLNDGCYRIGVIPPDGAHPTWETPTLQQWFDHDNNDIDPLTNHSRRFCLDATTRNDSHYRWKIGLTLPTDHAYTQIAAGYDRTCGLLADHRVACWGSGRGDLSGLDSEVPAIVPGITNASAIAVGSGHACAVLADGTVRCWGHNEDGELGDGTNNNSATPVKVTGITNATAATVGAYYSCAVLTDGTISCWGHNREGNLGDGTTNHSTTPVKVAGIINATAITATYGHTCAVLADGTATCWGANWFGQLGNGGDRASYVPVEVAGITNATAAATAGTYHSCALLEDGTATCWGHNGFGALGNGTRANSATPVPVSRAIRAGYPPI